MIRQDYFEIHRARYKYILDKVGKLAKGEMLDVGCYPDHLSKALEKQGWKVWGICSTFEKIRSKKVKAINIEKDRWPFEDKSMDLIIMTEIIEHLVGEPKKYLEEAYRILNDKGKILITTPNVVRWQNLINLILGRNIYFPLFQLEQQIYYRHNREYTMDELKKVLEKNKFKIIETSFFVGYPPYRQKNNKDKIVLKTIKWLNYYLSVICKRRRDSLYVLAEK